MEGVSNTPCLVDPGVVRHKRHFATPKLQELPNQRFHAHQERFGIKGAIVDLEVLDPVRTNDLNSQFRLSVGPDVLGRRSSVWFPGSESGCVEVEHTLDDEPEMLIRDPVVKDIVVEALFEFSGVKSTPTLDVVFFDGRR